MAKMISFKIINYVGITRKQRLKHFLCGKERNLVWENYVNAKNSTPN